MEPGRKPPKKPKKTPPKPSTPRGRAKAIRIADKSGKRSKSQAEAKRVEAVAAKSAREREAIERLRVAKERLAAAQAKKKGDGRHTTEPSSASTLVSARGRPAPRSAPPPSPPRRRGRKEDRSARSDGTDAQFSAALGLGQRRRPR